MHFPGCPAPKNRQTRGNNRLTTRVETHIMSTEELPPRESMEFDVVIVGAGPSGLVRGDPAETAQRGSWHRRGGERLRGRRAYPLGCGDRSSRPRQTDSGLARGRRLSAENRGQGRPLLLDERGRRDPPAEFHDAAADAQSSLLHRLARQCLPLARAQGGGARRRDLSGLCRHRSAVRRQGRGARHRHRRHGHRQGRLAEGIVHARHGAAAASTRCLRKARAAASPSN